MKKFLPYILIGVVIVGAFGPIGIKFSFAQQTLPETDRPCLGLIPPQFNPEVCLGKVGNLFLSIAGAILWVAGKFLNLAVDLSINKFSQYANMEGVKTAWKTIRDVVNLFFIFILLYIAIATILQISGYGMKELLVKVIIIALLVNFSLMITKVIIDASNILALEFYNKLDPSVVSDENLGISGIFVNGLKLTTVYKNYESGTESTAVEQFTITGVVFGTLGGILVILIASFVLFAYGIMFVLRTIALLFLIILSPLAFLAMTLPKTQPYAKDWWEKLFKWSFFAPAGLFMIYVVAMIISKGSLLEATGATQGEGLLGVVFAGKDVNILVYFIILIGLMIGSLIVAQQMGAKGAGAVMGWGQKLKGAARGYAGRVGKRYVGRAATAAEARLEKGEGKFAKTLKAVPFLHRGIAKTAQLTKKEVGKYEKQYAGYDTRTLEQLEGKFGTTREAREAIEKILTKRRIQEAKKVDVAKENERYKAIVGTPEKSYEDGELPKTKKESAFMAPEGYVERYAKIESRLETLRGEKTTEAEKERGELLVKREKLKEIKETIDKLNAEKEKIEENRARRREIEGLEERVAKAEAGIEGVAAKKPKEAGPEKT